MATDSKRELILSEVVDLIESIDSIVAVKRIRLNFADLGNFTGPQLPLVAVVGSLPDPTPHISGRQASGSDMFISSLSVDLSCYAMDNENPDTTISNLADDLWAKIYSSPRLETTDYPRGLVLGVAVKPELKTGIWDPYVVFKMACIYKYVHGIGGI